MSGDAVFAQVLAECSGASQAPGQDTYVTKQGSPSSDRENVQDAQHHRSVKGHRIGNAFSKLVHVRLDRL
tara:strand:+ start:762 stop:971 length:210 start_codon:yes stop_codon:yes gene_type:complete